MGQCPPVWYAAGTGERVYVRYDRDTRMQWPAGLPKRAGAAGLVEERRRDHEATRNLPQLPDPGLRGWPVVMTVPARQDRDPTAQQASSLEAGSSLGEETTVLP